MSSESVPASPPRPRSSPNPSTLRVPLNPTLVNSFIDWSLIGGFLALAFLLGVFPLKDTDFWWHLRTGDLIRQTGRVPTTDLYSFTVPDHAWIDLHWMFQVSISWLYAHGGVVALNLAKCAVTCTALLLLISARRRDWPIWVMILSWIPALLVLSGRMYVRPETLTLLYLSAFLAILSRWRRTPELALALPLIQVAWVNTQGLFILGPIILAFALFDAVLRRNSLAPHHNRWWKFAGLATLLTAIACLLNPYGLTGALYPLQLAATMDDPIFRKSIAELTPIPEFIRRSAGWNSLSLQLHIATMVVGALSFLIPLVWTVFDRNRVPSEAFPEARSTAPTPGRTRKSKKERASRPKNKKREQDTDPGGSWRLSPFRLLLFAAFSYLSWKATRNSHQFAAVVGAVTAWNFGEWASVVQARRAIGASTDRRHSILPPVLALAGLGLLFAFVGSGMFYRLTREGRTIGLGEEPLWYPHEAVKLCGELGMPARFVGFHDGYAGLYEYYNGPARKVYADARLEVMGREQYKRYIDLQSAISRDDPAWPRTLDDLGRPAILAGHEFNTNVGTVVMASPHWRCVWFDPIVAVFVHDAFAGAVQTHQVDFAARHFRPEASSTPNGHAALTASAKALWNYSNALHSRGRTDLARSMVLLGLDYARRLAQENPDALEGWKLMGQLEVAREAPTDVPVPRYRLSFDPVFDLSDCRATYALRRALAVAPDDFLCQLLLAREFADRGMDEETLPLLERLIELAAINEFQNQMQQSVLAQRDAIRARVGIVPRTTWENLGELDRVVTQLLSTGRVRTAAELLERAYPDEPRPWDVTERIATLRLHLGEPDRARVLWTRASSPPRPGVRSARIALCALVEGEFEEARRQYQDAVRAEPNLFEAYYGLAILEEETGKASEALSEARKAVRLAPNDVALAAAEAIAAEVKPFASP